MQEVITRLVDVPFARMFILAGIIFLLVAVLGKVEGKIDPGNMGRIGASILGIVLLVVGVLLQYIEIRDAAQEKLAIQAHLQGANNPNQPAAVSADAGAGKQPGVSVPSAPLKIVSATYGKSCNAKTGNATQALAKACDGKPFCDYTPEPADIEGAPANCARDFAAEWKCGSSNAVYSATFPANAGKNDKLHLECAS